MTGNRNLRFKTLFIVLPVKKVFMTEFSTFSSYSSFQFNEKTKETAQAQSK